MTAPRVLLITGCSSGIGRDLAERASTAGWSVAATARDVRSLDALDVAMRLPLDVTSEASVASAVAAVLERFGRVDALVNNAGYAVCAAVEELSSEQLAAIFEVNVFGVARMMRSVAPAMRAQRSGRIVNMSSIGAKVALPVNGAYSASKAAIEALSDSARLELAPFGVRVVVVEPGSVRTRFDETMRACSAEVTGDTSSPYAGLYRATAELGERMARTQAEPARISAVVLAALATPRPRARYFACAPASVRLLMRLGDGLRDRVLAAAMTPAEGGVAS